MKKKIKIFVVILLIVFSMGYIVYSNNNKTDGVIKTVIYKLFKIPNIV